jgi:hypothetical protein
MKLKGKVEILLLLRINCVTRSGKSKAQIADEYYVVSLVAHELMLESINNM